MKDFRDLIQKRVATPLSYEQSAYINQSINDKMKDGISFFDALDWAERYVKANFKETTETKSILIDDDARDIREALNLDKRKAAEIGDNMIRAFKKEWEDNDCVNAAAAIKKGVEVLDEGKEREKELIYIGWVAGCTYVTKSADMELEKKLDGLKRLLNNFNKDNQ